MKLLVICVGHRMPDWVDAGVQEFARRMPRDSAMQIVEVKAEPRTQGKPVEVLMEAERARIREQRRAAREQVPGSEGSTVANPSRPAVSTGMARNEGAARPVRAPRQAKVKVMAEDGSVEERDITIGISNRVHAEVLSGLKEGDRVVAGVREPERRTAGTQQGAGVGQAMGGPGGMPPGAAGGARR